VRRRAAARWRVMRIVCGDPEGLVTPFMRTVRA